MDIYSLKNDRNTRRDKTLCIQSIRIKRLWKSRHSYKPMSESDRVQLKRKSSQFYGLTRRKVKGVRGAVKYARGARRCKIRSGRSSASVWDSSDIPTRIEKRYR